MMKKHLTFFLFIFVSNLFAVDFSEYNSSLILLITKNDNKTFVCSSVAISKKKLLTASHCLDDAKSIKVVKEYKLQNNN